MDESGQKQVDAGAYAITVGPHALKVLCGMMAERQAGGNAFFVLVDDHSKRYCLPILEEQWGSSLSEKVLQIRPGEQHKNIQTCEQIWKNLNRSGADRKSLLVNLGGGVIGDMGGFAAATFKRGFDFVQVPTTLLSQVDASAGGKLGIDLDNLKNLVGVFQNPRAVFVYPEFLRTLEKRQLLSGFAEVIKHGLISDAAYFRQVSGLSAGDINDTIIIQSIRIKTAIVLEDPLEKGLRKILNFGHTLGHAIESWSMSHDADPLLHGEAIAIGMVGEAFLSLQYGLKEEELEAIVDCIFAHFPSYDLGRIPPAALWERMASDKKNEGGKVQFSLLSGIGKAVYDKLASEETVEEALRFYIQKAKR